MASRWQRLTFHQAKLARNDRKQLRTFWRATMQMLAQGGCIRKQLLCFRVQGTSRGCRLCSDLKDASLYRPRPHYIGVNVLACVCRRVFISLTVCAVCETDYILSVALSHLHAVLELEMPGPAYRHRHRHRHAAIVCSLCSCDNFQFFVADGGGWLKKATNTGCFHRRILRAEFSFRH